MADDGGQAATTSACPHPEAVGKRWGDPISPERQAELQEYLDRWEAETDHGERKGPFDTEPSETEPSEVHGVPLTGADVFWLAEQSGPAVGRGVPKLHLETLYVNPFGKSTWASARIGPEARST